MKLILIEIRIKNRKFKNHNYHHQKLVKKVVMKKILLLIVELCNYIKETNN